MTVTAPIVNLNGTSKEELLRLHIDAMHALESAATAMMKVTPHGRDFQTAGSVEVYRQAKADHLRRVNLLWSIHKELEEIALNISEQGS